MKSIAAAVSASFLLIAACGPAPGGGGGGGGTDGGTLPEFPAIHAAYPQVTNHFGPVLAHPRLVTITFAGYNYTSQVQAFGQKVVTSNWLTQAGAAYGVGTGTYLGNISFPTSPVTASDTGTATFIDQHITSGDLPVAGPGEDPILYMVFYNAGVPIALGYKGAASCSTFAGFHSDSTSKTHKFPFAVLPECSGDFGKWDYIEQAASHELIEAATDPWFSSSPGWYLDDPSNPWTALGGEVGDECVLLTVQENGQTYQRTWSNSAAKSGNQDPCVPSGVKVDFGVTQTAARIVYGTAGLDLSIPIHGWSAAKRTDWHVEPYVWTQDWAGNPTLDVSTMNNGDTAHLKVTIPAGTPHLAAALYIVYAWSDDGGASFWPVEITIR